MSTLERLAHRQPLDRDTQLRHRANLLI